MTKCIVLGEQPKEESKKPIEFKHYITYDLDKSTPCDPRQYKNIELIRPNYTKEGYDLMFAYDHNRSFGGLYLGHWNDGVV